MKEQQTCQWLTKDLSFLSVGMGIKIGSIWGDNSPFIEIHPKSISLLCRLLIRAYRTMCCFTADLVVASHCQTTMRYACQFRDCSDCSQGLSTQCVQFCTLEHTGFSPLETFQWVQFFCHVSQLPDLWIKITSQSALMFLHESVRTCD